MKSALCCGERWTDRLAVLLSLTFLIVASIPGTIALRYGLQVLLLVLLACMRPALVPAWRAHRTPVLLLALFMIYAGLHCWLIALWPDYAWGEYRTQLLVGALWFVIGLLLFQQRRGLSMIDLLITAGTVLALAEFFHGAWCWYHTGHWPFMETWVTQTHLEFTFIMNLVLAAVLACWCFGFRGPEKWTVWPRWSLLLIAVLIVFVSIRAGARNGMIGLIYLSLSLTAIYLYFESARLGARKMLAIATLVVAALTTLGLYSFHKDSRNQVLVPSATIGWHYSQTTAWYDGSPLPKMADGRSVDDSAYKRVAWFHRGLDLIWQNPMGYGYGRGAFALALESIGYHTLALAHAHSAIIDLGVGLGMPGILLWLAWCGTLIVLGFRAFSRRNDLFGLTLALISCGFVGRMMIESIMRDHMLYLFLFVSAALLAEMQSRQTAVAALPEPGRPRHG